MNIAFPDGSVKQFEQGVTPLQIAESISPRLAREVLAATINGEEWDISRPVCNDGEIKLFKWEDAEGRTFEATPRLILLGGHWSPFDIPNPYADEPQEKQIPWHWDRVAKKNPFFAQLWAPLHDKNEDNIYGAEVFNGWEK